MKFRSVSPTALAVAKACTSRWYSENVIGGRGFQSTAADLGTVCHSAMEYFVKMAVMADIQPLTEKTLLDFYGMFYIKIFKDHDYELPEYRQGLVMMRDWYKRNATWDEFEVLSVEQKKTFMVPTSAGEVPCNFIMDRMDRVDERTVRVVDYKTTRKRLYPEDVKRTTQGKIYAIAAKVQFPEVERVHVVFDQLRHVPAGVYFTTKDLEAAWKDLRSQVQKLVDLREDEIRETINPECGFCVKKNNCGAFRKHVEAGGIEGKTIPELLIRGADLLDARKQIDSAYEELDRAIVARLLADEDLERESEAELEDGTIIEARIKNSYSSFVNQEAVLELVGRDIFMDYATVSTAGHKQMLNDPRLTEEQVAALRGLKYRSNKGEKLSIDKKKV